MKKDGLSIWSRSYEQDGLEAHICKNIKISPEPLSGLPSLSKKKCIYFLLNLYPFLTIIFLFIPHLILGLAMVILLNRLSVSII